MKTRAYNERMNFDLLTDLELFRLIQDGRKEALEALFNRYYESLCRFGLTFEAKLDIVEEKVSDVFIQLWDHHDRLHQVRNPKPYLFVVVKNKLLEPSSALYPKSSSDTDINNLPITSPSIEQEIIDQEQREFYIRRIREVLDQIPQKSRQIFEMSRLDGLKYKEISEILDVSIKTVENHMAIALKTIRIMVIKNKQY